MSVHAVFQRDTPRFVESETGRPPKFPLSSWRRWGLRALIALFLVVLVVRYDVASGHDWSGTANGAMAARVSHLQLVGDVDIVGQLYPPVTTLAALLIPGGALGLGVAGALVAGVMVQLVIQALARKRFGMTLRVMFAVTLVTTPLFSYLVTTNFAAAVALTFFGIGMVDLVRFVTYANTQAGFRAGLLFALASMSDSTTLLSALVAAVAAMLIVQSRGRARLANAVVIAFPTASLVVALVALGIAFGAGPFALFGDGVGWNGARAAGFVATFADPLGWLYVAPMVVIVAACIALRYPATAIVAVLLTATVVFAYIVGLTPTGLAGMAYTMLMLLAVAIVPEPTSTVQQVLVGGVAVLLWLIGWLSAFNWQVVGTWMRVLGGTG